MLVGLSLAGCGVLGGDDNMVATAAMGTVRAVQSVEALPTTTPSHTPSPTASRTPEPSSTSTPTPTELPPVVRVSVAASCRSGPGATFPLLGVLEAGDTTEVLGRSTIPDYWYVINPDQPDGRCWLWGENAALEGAVETLPELTPVPSPRPALGFQLYLYGFGVCDGQTRLILIVQNTGQKRLMSSNLHVYNSDAGKKLHGPAFERHPFADSTGVCPPGHGNILDPGGGAYIIIPLKSSSTGDLAYADVKLCTEDFLGGDCQTNTIYFRLP